MKTIIICKGLPGSGKSTWAREVVVSGEGFGIKGEFTRVNKDDLRAMMHESKWSKHKEKEVLEARDNIVIAALNRGRHVIVDDTNLAGGHVDRIQEIARQQGNTQVIVNDTFLEVPLEECHRRNLLRVNSVPPKVIDDMYNKFVKPLETQKSYPVDPNKPYTILVDMDGTLAHKGERSPYDMTRVYEDTVNTNVAELVRTLHKHGSDEITIFSARNMEAYEDTKSWLNDHNIPWDYMYMRDDGDTRKDSVVKQEMLECYVLPDYNVRFVIDDRAQVVDMWRSLGIECWQVAEGNF